MREWIKKSWETLWSGILKNLGTYIFASIVSVACLIAIRLNEFQLWVRKVPTDYVLAPLVLLLVALGVVLWINHKQRQKLSRLETQPPTEDAHHRFVTHCGVWWKIYPDSEYIEDFPYCPCCEPKLKLVQVEWVPDEKYRCPKTGTEVKLYGPMPRNREEIVGHLYEAYFGWNDLGNSFLREYMRIMELNPIKTELEAVREVFTLEPFSRIPENEVEKIIHRFPRLHEVLAFMDSNFRSYSKYFLRKDKQPS